MNAKGRLRLCANTKIFNRIKCRDDTFNLQADIDLLESWSRMWLLIFHPDKCQVLTAGKFENIRHSSLQHIWKRIRSCIRRERRLPISFEEHISLREKKANAIMGVLLNFWKERERGGGGGQQKKRRHTY